jgi:predicted acetyltransferase
MAAVVVRPIVADELQGWVETMHLAFLLERPAPEIAVFRRDVLKQDLSRTLGAFDGACLAGTLWSFPAELAMPGGTTVPADAVSIATVRPTHRRRGLLTNMLQTDLRAARERGELVSILYPAEYPIYGRFGFGPATEQASYRLDRATAHFKGSPQGRVELVEPPRMRELAPQIFDRFRRDRPGQIDRQPINWDIRLGLQPVPWNPDQKPPRCAVLWSPDGAAAGYLLYRVEGHWEGRVPAGRLEVAELIATSSDAYLGLWRYCCEVDLIGEVTADTRSLDEPLGWLLDNPRAALKQTQRIDSLWLRPLDVSRTLAARRYVSEARVVIDVADPSGLSGGRFALEGGPTGATCSPGQQSADLSMGLPALGTLTLGGVSPRLLAEAGWIEEHTPGALDTAERLFRWPITPWCSTFF